MTPVPPLPVEPLRYHLEVVRHLEAQEVELWKWFSAEALRGEQADAVRLELLKSTYRLDADAHAALHAAAREVAAKLGLTSPITLYQAQGSTSLNASLAYLPGEPHVVLHGPVTDRLTPAELRAVLGHELSHFVLLERWEGFRVASQILQAMVNDEAVEPAHVETARRFGLYTEVYCDRGAELACGDLAAAVSALVKIETGIGEASAESFLRQADEIFRKGSPRSSGVSHPETFVRARALQLWSELPSRAPDEVRSVIEGPPALGELDLLGQRSVAALTRRLIATFLRPVVAPDRPAARPRPALLRGSRAGHGGGSGARGRARGWRREAPRLLVLRAPRLRGRRPGSGGRAAGRGLAPRWRALPRGALPQARREGAVAQAEAAGGARGRGGRHRGPRRGGRGAMTSFHEFLRSRLAGGGFSTGDVLASFLPLARQVVDAHATGRVAPLDGVSALHVEGSRIWFHDDALERPSGAPAELRRLDRPAGTVEVLSDRRRTLDVERAGERVANLEVGGRDEPLTRPVYLAGYACWEHVVGHHDPVTDVFSLGQVLASLACGLDLAEPADLEAFVSHRRNLFALRPGLHPVLAKAIVKMTELGRRDRPQELATLVHNLEHYRDQGVDFDFDLASAEATAGGRARRPVILGKLRERLFELSRRNRLLHFRATLSSVNLTHASVPLAFDVQHVQPEQILTWSGSFAGALSSGEPVSLNGHLDFAEQLYLPSVLDRVRTDAARDAAEFGFEQLRLAICFLRWANLKEDPPDHYDSPLVLLPVRLVKKKGVRDSWWLQPLGTEAEVNPVVRHLFAQLYGIALPETIDLSEGSLDALYEELAARIAVSEPGVTLRKIQRPRIDLIHDLARRRLDRYRRSARLAGRGIRSFLEVDYSYDPANFHPLGLALFRARVRARPTHLREILQERPAPRSWAAPPAPEEQAVATREASFYALREASDDNPYHWDFDLCRVTLGNFKYRKMTLVRDYAQLLEGDAGNEAFDAVFSLAPRPVEWEAPRTSPLPERYPVVSCDPTQASAIALARAGASYIIQGPPGTGKSQTITNLVADYVVRGKRVLFVCEKRAAIDVVYARLRQQGLDSLCCLIHDSQADKKPFLQDLKATYERLLAEPAANPRTWRIRRAALLDGIRRELEPLEAFDRAMRAAPATAGVPLRAAFERALELVDELPALGAPARDGLPNYADWVAHAEAVAGLTAAVADLQPDAIFAHHPLRLLGPAVVGHARPAQLVGAGVTAASEALGALRAALAASGVDPALARTLDAALALGEWADGVAWLARRDLAALLEERSEPSRRLARARQALAAAREALTRSTAATTHWTEKLPRDEAAAALAQASALEGSWLAPIRPAWWRLRKVLTARYAFARHAITPTWSQVLRALVAEYEAGDAVAAADRTGREALGVEESLDEVAAQVETARRGVAQLPRALAALHDEVLRSDRCAERVATAAAVLPPARALRATLGEFAAAFEAEPLDRLGDALRAIEGALPRLGGALEVLGLLARLPAQLATAFRTLPLTPRQLEAALVSRCVDEQLQSDRLLNRFDGAVRDRHLAQLARLSALWQEANAGTVLEQAREAFLEKVRITSLPAAELSREQKEFKAAYSRGRRELEHEFGKVMRHKSIRDLVAGDSGPVVLDLKPVWLMSPLERLRHAAAATPTHFDVVIFDEASQITLEEAVPSLFRAPQAIVVGDEMQLPPTDFFSRRADERGRGGAAASRRTSRSSSTTSPQQLPEPRRARTCRPGCSAGTTAADRSR